MHKGHRGPLAAGSRLLDCSHSDPHRVRLSSGPDENLHVRRSSNWAAVVVLPILPSTVLYVSSMVLEHIQLCAGF